MDFEPIGLQVEEKERRIANKEKLPYLVIIDAFSGLIMYRPEEFERLISELTSNAVDVGIHLIMCDSRPSVDVYTEKIKKCFPAKIAFNTTSSIDSKVIIDQAGAEKLLGRGDMLFLGPKEKTPTRLQAPYITDQEVQGIVTEAKTKHNTDEKDIVGLGFSENEVNSLYCKAFIVDLFTKRYMLHIWLKPHLSVGWHRKRDGLVGKLFLIKKYN